MTEKGFFNIPILYTNAQWLILAQQKEILKSILQQEASRHERTRYLWSTMNTTAQKEADI